VGGVAFNRRPIRDDAYFLQHQAMVMTKDGIDDAGHVVSLVVP
jgi:hypothetical protein